MSVNKQTGHLAAAVYAATEQRRHECEVRYVAAMPYAQRVEYLTGTKSVASIRGPEAARRIIDDLKRLADGRAKAA